ncbi:pyridoxal-phosphate-dependent aminotransferase family protein [Halapricum hydrolyticum]|uniref:Alanine--glyoxylate aminotransferase family protein n=1 Tax=Halapricum hydrolyticum TaxID=2979991 RepID=A0AAE3I9Z2_9EURY|nr:alanine--glyoxylate aminotransferase family protein [Halapricum hydrolyticum]MCU4717370.1 alanine--glyoxylate aminotransferase family protein [Halapricum hydrolyticum]MCU4726297.1 alanine--glyoxylate aminotransferase family protein [Halapricum hydrolyticum]
MAGDDDRLRMTPGPTAVPPEVRDAMARPAQNPDVEPEFTEYYRTLLEKLSTVYGTDDDIVILGGEGMVGLEAAVASLLEPGETALCLANGSFGDGFADLVEMHGAIPVRQEAPPDAGFDAETTKEHLEEHDVAVATMVHCETPTGALNGLKSVLEVLDDAGVLTIVDAVSSLGGAPVPTETTDVVLSASQKCLSSPPGLATLSVSDAAWAKVEATDQDTFYTNLLPWHDIGLDDEGPPRMPYTHLISNLYALEASLDRLLEEGIDRAHRRHERVARQCRERGAELGLEPFQPPHRRSPTVTAFEVDGRAGALQRRLLERDVLVATSLGKFADDLLRIGHMGYNADPERVGQTMDALEAVLEA